MSKQNKTLIFDQVARHARIKKENEEHLSQTLKLYQEYGKIENNELIDTVIDSLSTIEFFKQNCPEGMKLSEFITNAIKYFQFEQYDYGQPIFHYGEYGDKMYIILKGEVGVFGPRPLDDINRDIEQLKKSDEIELVKVLRFKRIKLKLNQFQNQQYKKNSQQQILITYLKYKERNIIKMEYHKILNIKLQSNIRKFSNIIQDKALEMLLQHLTNLDQQVLLIQQNLFVFIISF